MRYDSKHVVLISALLILGVMLHISIPAPSWAQSLKKRSQLTVVDAKGKKVGRVFSIGSGTFIRRPAGIEGGAGVLVAFQVTGHPPFVLEVTPTHFFGSAYLYFVSPDCSGSPFMQGQVPILVGADLSGYGVSSSSLLPPVAVAIPGQTVYIPDPAAPVQSIVPGSLLIEGTCAPLSGSPATDVRPALALIDLERIFTPPFSIR